MTSADSLRGRAALMVAHCAGLIDLVALPVWVGSLIAQFGFAPGGVVSVTTNSSTQLTATVEIRGGGPRKNQTWDVRVTNPDGTTAVGARLLTITP